MPQPLSRVNSKAGFRIANVGDYPIVRNAELGLLAMKIISGWSTLEALLSNVLVKMLGANPQPAMAMYAALKSTAAQIAALRAAADAVLPHREFELFEAILELFSSAASERNKIAHWVWGCSPEVPDGILLCHPAAMTAFHLDVVLYESQLRDTAGARPLDLIAQKLINPNVFEHLDLPTFPIDKILVYTSVDFTSAISRIERVSGHVFKFKFMLMRDHGANANDELFRQLCDEPDISSILYRNRRRRKSWKK